MWSDKPESWELLLRTRDARIYSDRPLEAERVNAVNDALREPKFQGNDGRDVLAQQIISYGGIDKWVGRVAQARKWV